MPSPAEQKICVVTLHGGAGTGVGGGVGRGVGGGVGRGVGGGVGGRPGILRTYCASSEQGPGVASATTLVVIDWATQKFTSTV
jgi:hypothetical protein